MKVTKTITGLAVGLLSTLLVLTTHGQTPVSDDFNAVNPNTNTLWTVQDAGGASGTNFGTFQIVGYGTSNVDLQIGVPGGDNHVAYQLNNAVELLQPVDGSQDFSVSAKFESMPNQPLEGEGIIFVASDGTATRFDAAYDDGVSSVLFQENIKGIGTGAPYPGTSVSMADIPTNSTGPIYLRVQYTASSGNVQTYTSRNGVSWTARAGLSIFPFLPSMVGIAANNESTNSVATNAPAFTVRCDYFFNDASPIVYEDGQTNTQPPSISLTSPKFYLPLFDTASNLTATLTATASGSGFVTNVALFAGTNLVASTIAPTSGSTYSLTWTNLPTGDYPLFGVATDNQGLSSTSAPVKVYIRPAGPLTSDDFNSSSINTNLWAMIDPVGDDHFSIVGSGTGESHLLIDMNPGVEHDSFQTTLAPRVMQVITNQDFTVVVKFDTLPSKNYQIEGILVEDITGKGVRMDGARYGSVKNGEGALAIDEWNGVNIGYGGAFVSDMAYESPLPPPPPAGLNVGTVYQMVQKSGDSWTVSMSPDGVTWIQTASFVYHLVVNHIGVYGDTHNPNPKWAPMVDYFMNADAPVTNEDGSTNAPPTVNLLSPTAGQGFKQGSLANLGLDALESTGSIAKVEFFAWTNGMPNPSLIATSTDLTTPFTAHWSNSLPLGGSTYIYAKATANEGATTYSPIVSIVSTSGTNGTIVGEDFNATSINSNVWLMVNSPVDGTFTNQGAFSGHADLLITAPGNIAHTPWAPNTAPQLLEVVGNQPFTIDAKFDTVPGVAGQDEGFIVKDINGNFRRFDVELANSTDTNLTAFTGYIQNGAGHAVSSTPVTDVALPTNGNVGTIYLKVNWDGTSWTFYTSPNGTNWTVQVNFPDFAQPFVVAQVGLFAGNPAGTPFTAAVDYFEDSTAPLTNQDAVVFAPSLSIALQGSQVAVSWTDTLGFGLYATPSLSSPSWTPVTNIPVLNVGQDTVTLPIGTNQFYRLQK